MSTDSAYRRLAVTILGLDVATLAAELQAARDEEPARQPIPINSVRPSIEHDYSPALGATAWNDSDSSGDMRPSAATKAA